MITLQSDCLQFSFPEIDERLRGLVENHIQQMMPRLLAENREPALTQLKSRYGYQEAGQEGQKAAVEQLMQATPKQIEEALRRVCESQCNSVEGDYASVGVEFQRTLRIPDDGEVYPLPAGLGRFPLRHIDDYEEAVPASWRKRGGVMMPMHQSEALWLNFTGQYPFAVKVGTGKINAVTGDAWAADLQRDPQDYLVRPEQPWLDGFSVGEGIIRQFVAMPLGEDYSVEEQLTGNADVGGIQLQVYPMRAEAYFEKELKERLPRRLEDLLEELVGYRIMESGIRYCYTLHKMDCSSAMGLGAGGTMRQEIYQDYRDPRDWDLGSTSRCFVHLCNSLVWRQMTGSNPPHPPLTLREYADAHVPWFDHYRDDLEAVGGSETLAAVKSVVQMGEEKGGAPVTENTSVSPNLIVQSGNARRPDEVREWSEEG